MSFSRTCQALLLGAFLLAIPTFAAPVHHRTASVHHARYHKPYHRRVVRYRHYRRFIRGQRGIQPQRAREIQDALIRVHYLSGPASGHWDVATQDAMRKYQADHGWQTRLIPDSRALISLGLGPKGDHVLAADSAPGPAAHASSSAGSSDSSSGSSASSSQSSSSEGDTLADFHTLRN